MAAIREEQPEDAQQIGTVIRQAFGQTEEADIVDKLRQNCPDKVSLIAASKDQMVGQILFTPVTIQAKDRPEFAAPI